MIKMNGIDICQVAARKLLDRWSGRILYPVANHRKANRPNPDIRSAGRPSPVRNRRR